MTAAATRAVLVGLAVTLVGCGAGGPVGLVEDASGGGCLAEVEDFDNGLAACDVTGGRLVSHMEDDPTLRLAVAADAGQWVPTVVGDGWTVSSPSAQVARAAQGRVGGVLLVDVCDFQRWAGVAAGAC